MARVFETRNNIIKKGWDMNYCYDNLIKQGVIHHRVNRGDCLHAPRPLPWCPWHDRTEEIYKFLLGCPLSRRKCLGAPLPFQKWRKTSLGCVIPWIYYNKISITPIYFWLINMFPTSFGNPVVDQKAWLVDIVPNRRHLDGQIAF